MATHTQIGGVTVDAFQWNGTLTGDPAWMKNLALHVSGDGSLHVPTRAGTLKASLTDWVVQGADKGIDVVPNSHFVKLYS